MHRKQRALWLRFAVAGSVLTVVLHLVVLVLSGQDPITTPISELSRHRFGGLHTLGLAFFGCAHVALAGSLGGLDPGPLWRAARILLVVAGVGLIYVAIDFASLSRADPGELTSDAGLWLVASLTGMAMGAMQPGLSRQARRLGVFSAICLGVWLWMIPVFLFADRLWLGASQRIVGGIYILWLVVVAAGLLRETEGVRQNRG